MKDLKLNNAWDLDIANANFSFVDKVDYTAQSIRQNLNFFYGEFFLDNTLGFPILQQVLVKNPNLNIIRIRIIETITKEDYVKELTNLNFQIDSENRKLIISFSAICMNDEEINDTINFNIG
jgi:hypothetical protein